MKEIQILILYAEKQGNACLASERETISNSLPSCLMAGGAGLILISLGASHRGSIFKVPTLRIQPPML